MGAQLELILQAIAVGIAGIITTVCVILRKKIEKLFQKKLESIGKLKIHKVNHISKQEVDIDWDIHSILTELRINTSADRAQVFQFHNGRIFSTRNQMWKVLCTHEIVDTVTSCLHELQDIISSSITEWLVPLWGGDISKYPGCYKISPESCECCHTSEGCEYPNGVYLIKVQEMKPGFSRGLLSSHNIKYMIQSPIVDQEENVVGFVALSWCWEETDVDQIKGSAELLCKTASTIAYKLSCSQH